MQRNKRCCVRCQTEMIEDCDIKSEGGCYGLTVSNKTSRFFPDRIGKPNVAICPNCGEISLFIKNTEAVKTKEKA